LLSYDRKAIAFFGGGREKPGNAVTNQILILERKINSGMRHFRIRSRLRPFRLSLTLLILAASGILNAQDDARFGVDQSSTSELCLAINPATHQRFGVAYPLTFRFALGINGGVIVERKFKKSDSWTALAERRASEVYNAVEGVRIDSSAAHAYVSLAFSPASDSIFLRFTTAAGIPLAAHYLGMPEYYDGRKAAVVVTADDWADWFADMFPPLLSLFRSYGLYVTAGAITGGVGYNTWITMQSELDSGFVEIAGHSRSHPSMPYSDYSGEVLGCIDDITNNLSMPSLFQRNDQGYVYVWIAPNGRTNSTVDSLLTRRNILVNRLYGTGDTAFSAWSAASQKFLPLNPTIEIGNPSWGGGETRIEILNATFDSVTARGGIYHFMWHPQTLSPDIHKPYLSEHLKHISKRGDLWYVNLGHLYLYHFFQMVNSTEVTSVPLAQTVPGEYGLSQNWPNPFNPSTSIKYTIGGVRGQGLGARDVSLIVYDVLGREVATLVNEEKSPGSYLASFDGSKLASGVYVYRLTSGSFVQSRTMVLVK
jgi:hypothetical protein